MAGKNVLDCVGPLNTGKAGMLKDLFFRLNVGCSKMKVKTLNKMKRKQNTMGKSGRRQTRILVIDQDPMINAEDSIVYEKVIFTDSNDAVTDHLFSGEVDIAGMLAAHNEKRVATKDQDASDDAGRDVFLKPTTLSKLVKREAVVTRIYR